MKARVKKEIKFILIALALGLGLAGLCYYLNSEYPQFRNNDYITLESMIIMYVLGGFGGAAYEFLLYAIRDKQYLCTSGSLLLPVNFVYGFGAIAVVGAMFKIDNPFFVFLLGGILAGVIETLISFLEQKFFGTRSWNYSEAPFNFWGRTSVLVMCVWGLLAVFILCVIYRPLAYFFANANQSIISYVCYGLTALVAFDMLCSYPAYGRFMYRAKRGIKIGTGFFAVYDRIFNDKVMLKHYPKAKIDGVPAGEVLAANEKKREEETRAAESGDVTPVLSAADESAAAISEGGESPPVISAPDESLGTEE